MTRFENGPARGQNLNLQRAACFLRVTHDGVTWDALDQLADEPRRNEVIYAYEIVGTPVNAFVDGAQYSGPTVMATYRLVEPQPADAAMRTLAAWSSWCERKAAGA